MAFQKLLKMFFISSKIALFVVKIFNFLEFFSSFPHFTDSKGQIKVE